MPRSFSINLQGVDFNWQILKPIFEQKNESQQSLSSTKLDMHPKESKEIYMITSWSFDKEKLWKDFYSEENKEKWKAFFDEYNKEERSQIQERYYEYMNIWKE